MEPHDGLMDSWREELDVKLDEEELDLAREALDGYRLQKSSFA